MRRSTSFLLAGLIVLLLGTAGILFSMYRRAIQTNRDSETREAAERADYDRALAALADIRDSLSAVGGGTAPMGQRSEGLSSTLEERRRDALARISDLDAKIGRDRQRISQLEEDLRKRGARDAKLERTIASLKQSVAEEEATVAQLTDQLNAMTTKVAGLETEVQQGNETIRAREATIEEKRRELATVYVLIGTRKSLMQAGVITAEGGVLGMGRSLQVSTHLDERLFTPLDTDRDSLIRIPAKKAVVLSAQPAASYALRSDGTRSTLAILDPAGFRKLKHVIIRAE